jgi:hypothetical protein
MAQLREWLEVRGLGRWLVNDLADDVLSEQDRISLAITVRTMKEETEKWQSASNENAFVRSRRDPYEKIMGWLLPRAHQL